MCSVVCLCCIGVMYLGVRCFVDVMCCVGVFVLFGCLCCLGVFVLFGCYMLCGVFVLVRSVVLCDVIWYQLCDFIYGFIYLWFDVLRVTCKCCWH